MDIDPLSIILGAAVALLLGAAAVYLHRRHIISRLALVLLAPPLALIPISWSLAAFNQVGRMEPLRCLVALVIPLSVAAWLLARVVGLDRPDSPSPLEEEEQMSLPLDMEQESRERWAVENILESESLTADLPDAEAERLLEWATTQARRLADDPSADEGVSEERLGALRKLIRGINTLAGESRPVDDERETKRFKRLTDTAEGLNFPSPDKEDVDTYIADRHHLTVGQRLDRLLALFAESG